MTGLVRSTVRPATEADQRRGPGHLRGLRQPPSVARAARLPRPRVRARGAWPSPSGTARWSPSAERSTAATSCTWPTCSCGPDFVGHGAGSAILEALFDRGERPPDAASGDPRALPLYARFGMRPLMPALYLHADGRRDRAPSTLRRRHWHRRPRTSSPRIDAEVSGRPRAAGPRVPGVVPRRGGLRAGRPGRAGARTGGSERCRSTPGRSGAARVRRSDRRPDRGGHGPRDAGAGASVPRPGRRTSTCCSSARTRAWSPLLAAGFRLVDRDTWMCSRLDLVDGRRYAPSPELG